MKFQVERDVLAEAVAWAARTLPARPAQPMLAGILIEADKNSLTLSAFDYEVSSRVSIDAGISESGKVLVSGKLFADISRSLPNQPVVGTLNGSRLEIKCGKANFALPTLPPDDYPTLPPLPKTSGSAKAKVFAESVAQVAVAAGRDESLPMLTGIRVEIEGNTITLAATDRYRLAVKEFSWNPNDPKVSTAALVPARTLAEGAKGFLNSNEILISLASDKDKLMGFEGEGRRTTTRLLDADFPKYRSLLPSESTSTADVSTQELLDAIKRVELVAERNTPIRLDFRNNELVLRAGAGEDATAEEVVGLTLNGEGLEIAFNAAYLKDGLSSVNAPITRMSFTAASKPAVLSGVNNEGVNDDSYRYLIMPVRLAG